MAPARAEHRPALARAAERPPVARWPPPSQYGTTAGGWRAWRSSAVPRLGASRRRSSAWRSTAYVRETGPRAYGPPQLSRPPVSEARCCCVIGCAGASRDAGEARTGGAVPITARLGLVGLAVSDRSARLPVVRAETRRARAREAPSLTLARGNGNGLVGTAEEPGRGDANRVGAGRTGGMAIDPIPKCDGPAWIGLGMRLGGPLPPGGGPMQSLTACLACPLTSEYWQQSHLGFVKGI